MKFKKLTSLLALAACGVMSTEAQTVSTFMGIAGSSLDPVDPTKGQAVLYAPWGMAFDNVGNFLLMEGANSFATPAVNGNRLRLLLDTDQKLYKRAGDPSRTPGYYNFPLSPTSRFNEACGIALDLQNNVYIADRSNHAIRKVDKFITIGSSQSVSTFAGALPDAGFQGTPGDAVGAANVARFNNPQDIVFDGNNTFYVADTDNNKIKKINATTGDVSLYAGTGNAGSDDGAVANATFNSPAGLALDNNKLYIADQVSRKIRVIDLATNTVSTLAGSGTFGMQDGAAATATFKAPLDVAVDNQGNVYVVEGIAAGGVIRKIASGQVTTFAGADGQTGTTDGVGAAARFNDPRQIVFNPNDNLLYVADFGNGLIRTVTIGAVAAPDAIINAADTIGKPNDVLTFIDQSTGNPTSRTWSVVPNTHAFINGTTSSTANADIKFTALGTYTVTLQVGNTTGSDIATQKVYITATSVNEMEAASYFSVYPNPASSFFTVKPLRSAQSFKLIFTDLAGRVINEQNSNGEELSLNTNGLSKGIYLLHMEVEGKVLSRKISIQ